MICEVGVGGRYDATNAIPAPVACGVSTLDLDHVATLGDTLPKIAWEKGGIFKRGAACFSVAQSDGEAYGVLQRCAADAGCDLQLVAPLDERYKLGLQGGAHQHVNAGLAVALCAAVLGRPDVKTFINEPVVSESIATDPFNLQSSALHARII